MLTSHDLHLIERDTKLPHLRQLLDSELYTPLIRERAPETDASDVILSYLRYKPGMNCIAGYEYRAGGSTHYAYAKIFSGSQAEKRVKAHRLAGYDNVEDPVAVTFFPIDGRLRSLKKLISKEEETRFLQRLFSERDELQTGELVPIRYKPERRFVSRLTVEGQSRAVVKMHTRTDFARIKLYSGAFASRGNLVIADRPGHSKRHTTMAYEWLPGTLLSDSLRSGALDAKAVAPVGEALAHLHAQRVVNLPMYSLELRGSHVDAVGRQIAFLCPDLADAAGRTAQKMAALMQPATERFTGTHGDFYAKQILLHEGSVGVLDFDECALTDPMTDIGNFLAHLERDRLRFDLDESMVHDCREAFVAGYTRAGGVYETGREALFRATNLFKLLPHPFRFREDDWPDRTAQLLDAVHKTLHSVTSTTHPSASARLYSTEVSPGKPEPAHDGSMPFLEQALDPSAALPVIAPALDDRFPGYDVVSIDAIHLLRHKPGRRCLIEYVLQLRNSAGEAIERRILGKARAKGIDKSTFQLTQTLWQSTFNSAAEDGIEVPEPLAGVPEFNMWLQEKIKGETVTEVLEQPEMPSLARSIADALHKLNSYGPFSKRSHGIQDELAILEKRLPLVAEENPAWSQQLDDVMSGCRLLAERIPETAPRPLHRDFYPDNLLVADTRIYLLDLDLYCMGDPALDAGNFIAHVMEYALRRYHDPDMLQDCTRAFEDRFVALNGRHCRTSIHIYTILALARHIHISTLFPDRKAYTAALLALCERHISNLLTSNNSEASLAL